jgi:hypothetical protein
MSPTCLCYLPVLRQTGGRQATPRFPSLEGEWKIENAFSWEKWRFEDGVFCCHNFPFSFYHFQLPRRRQGRIAVFLSFSLF